MLEAHFWWVLIGLCLVLAELLTGTVVLLALSLAVFLTAAVAYFNIGIVGQLIALGVSGTIFVPVAIKVIRPYFSPAGIHYGSVGAGAENGKLFEIVERDFDHVLGIKIHGDFFRAELVNALTSDDALQTGDHAIFDHFDGTTAKVHRQPPNNTSPRD